jgi:hypothetical protein
VTPRRASSPPRVFEARFGNRLDHRSRTRLSKARERRPQEEVPRALAGRETSSYKRSGSLAAAGRRAFVRGAGGPMPFNTVDEVKEFIAAEIDRNWQEHYEAHGLAGHG